MLYFATAAFLIVAAEPPADPQSDTALLTAAAGSQNDVQVHTSLTLEEALRVGRTNQPTLRQAHAVTNAAKARADEALAPLLPQIGGTAAYQRTTSNFVLRPGALPTQINSTQTNSTLKMFNFYNFGLNGNQLIYDFGQTTGRYDAAKATAQAQGQTEQGTQLTVDLNVRAAYFNARAAKALRGVAKDTYTNQDKHLGQIQGFVEVGTRPAIDLAQGRTDLANAKVQVINSDNSYLTAKAQLNQAMGVEAATDYEVVDDSLPPVPGEEQPLDPLLEEALRARPEYAAYQSQIRAQELTIRAIQGLYGPALGLTAGATEAGSQLDRMGWNLNAGLSLTWQLFQGGLTTAQVREARANLASLQAQADGFRQQVRLDVEQARLDVRAAREGLSASNEVVVNAQERLKLAEGRYETGVGNVIELGDAQLALTSAQGQQVQAAYSLSAARARLLRALGRS